MKFSLLLILLFLANNFQAQGIKDLEIIIDSTGFLNATAAPYFSLYIEVTTRKGKTKRIDLNSKPMDWNNFKITSNKAFMIKRGLYAYSLDDVDPTNNLLSITVLELHSMQSKTIQFKVPYLSGITVKPKTLEPGKLTKLDFVTYLSNGLATSEPNRRYLNQLDVQGKELNIQFNGEEIMPILTYEIPYKSVEISFFDPNQAEVLYKGVFRIIYPTMIDIQLNGESGSQGKNGQSHTGAYGKGADGQNGGNGHDGAKANIFAWKTTYEGSDYVIVKGENQHGRQFLNILKANEHLEINIHAQGGRGGDGGHGGQGANGMSGQNVSYSNGTAGSGGNAGSGGRGGNGGEIDVYLPDSAAWIASHLHFNIAGAEGGLAGNAGQSGQNNDNRTDPKLLEALLGPNDPEMGKNGSRGMKGQDGIKRVYFLSAEDFNSLKRERLNF